MELQYYDGLADQETSILLTVRPARPPAPAALVSPIEHCIRTKYVVSCLQRCTAAPGGREPPWTGTGPSRYYDQQPYSLFVFLDINNIQHGFIICCDG